MCCRLQRGMGGRGYRSRRMSKKTRALAWGLAVAAPLAAVLSAAAARAAPPGALHASDGWMRDAHGRAVMLRGANLDVGLRRPTARGDLSTAAPGRPAQASRPLRF